MDKHILFFKDQIIEGNTVEITFHKDFSHIFNTETFPVVKYTLLNCQDLASKNFTDIDQPNDGLLVETHERSDHFVFEVTDLSGDVFKIICEKLTRQELEYRKQDYVDLLKEITKQRDEEYELTNKYYHRLEDLKLFLQKAIDINERKLKQADWLTNEKKKFLEGELSGYRKVFESITDTKNT